MPEKYVIYAGEERPAFIKANHLEKRNGQISTVPGQKDTFYANRPGDVGFPNMTEAWGVRLDKEGKVPSSALSVTDSNYDGKVKWLEWGNKDGCVIVSRWLSGFNTLDFQYQKLVLKADDRIKEDDDTWFIIMQSGLNEFDLNNDKLFVEHLQISSYNRESKSKNPAIIGYQFHEKDEIKEQKVEIKTIESKVEAGIIVKAASKDNSHSALRNLARALSKLVTTLPEDENLYSTLMNLADKEPDVFLAQVNEHKKMISNLFVKAESFKLLDLTKDGIVAAGKDLKEPILTDCPVKGKNALEYILENCFEDKCATAIYKLKTISDKIN